jgi:hypothetical protein
MLRVIIFRFSFSSTTIYELLPAITARSHSLRLTCELTQGEKREEKRSGKDFWTDRRRFFSLSRVRLNWIELCNFLAQYATVRHHFPYHTLFFGQTYVFILNHKKLFPYKTFLLSILFSCPRRQYSPFYLLRMMLHLPHTFFSSVSSSFINLISLFFCNLAQSVCVWWHFST